MSKCVSLFVILGLQSKTRRMDSPIKLDDDNIEREVPGRMCCGLALAKIFPRRVFEVFFLRFPIIAATALAEADEEFVIESLGAFGFGLEVLAPEGDDAADFDGQICICRINHRQIHTDPADDFDLFVMQNRCAAIAFIDGDSVCIACADHGNAHIARRNICAIIAERLAGLHVTDLQDRREERGCGFADFLARFIRRHAAVEPNAGPHHLEMIGLAEIYACRIGKRHRGKGEMSGGFAKPLQLSFVHGARRIGRAGEVAHDPFRVERAPQRFVAAQGDNFIHRQAKAVHSRVDVNGRIGRLSNLAGDRAPELGLLHRVDDRFELCAQQHAFIARGGAIQDVNRGIGANTVPQQFAFARRGDEENPATRAVKRLGNRHSAEPVSISFDRRADLGGSDSGFERVIISANLRKVDPQGRARGIAGLVNGCGHRRALNRLAA